MRKRLARASMEDGFTLVELLTTMVLLGIVLSIATLAMSSAANSYVDQKTYSDTLRLGTTAMNVMTKTIRGGTEIKVLNSDNLPAFKTATSGEIEVFVAQSERPELVRFFVNDENKLVRQTTPANPDSAAPYWEFSDDPESNNIIAYTVPEDEKDNIFTYFDSNDEEMDLSSVSDQSNQLSRIRSVRIDLTIDTDPNQATPVELINTVVLPNLGVIQDL